MALKPDRIESLVDISFFMNTEEERGGVACLLTGGSGVAMDDSAAVVAYATTPSGETPVGVLLNDVVDIDLTRQHINFHKDEVTVGGKVALLRVGQVTTDQLDGAPTAGDAAYVGASGLLTEVAEVGAARVGTFLSGPDSEGFAKVSINIV
jgi:hypothetical protein